MPRADLNKGAPARRLRRVGRHGHAMDEIRYFAATVAGKQERWIGAVCVEREAF